MYFQDLNVLDALAPKPLSVCRTKRAVYFLLAFLDFFVFAGTISSLPQFSIFLRRLSLFGVVYEVS